MYCECKTCSDAIATAIGNATRVPTCFECYQCGATATTLNRILDVRRALIRHRNVVSRLRLVKQTEAQRELDPRGPEETE